MRRVPKILFDPGRQTVPRGISLGSGIGVLLLCLLLESHGTKAQVARSVDRVVDGMTIVVEGGTIVRLASVLAPLPGDHRRGLDDQPYAGAARMALENLISDQSVRLENLAAKPDRHGRWSAQVWRADGVWLQERLVGAGMVRVAPGVAQVGFGTIARLLERERTARTAGRGLWQHPAYAVRRPADTWRDLGRFVLVSGVVRDAARVRDRIYLNFGADWRSDFTVRIAAAHRVAFVAAGQDLLALAGRRVLVRGWLHLRNGPMIDLTVPGQIVTAVEAARR